MVHTMARLTSERLTGINFSLALVGALLTSWLVISELFREPTCPKLLGIPACYIVLVAYLAAAIGAWNTDSEFGRLAFMIGAVSVTAIGIYFSLGEIRGTEQCPTFEGLPMCFVSLFAGTSMLFTDQFRRRAEG